MSNTAPFPVQAALDQFTSSYTTAWLQQMSGLGGEAAKLAAQSAATPPFRQTLHQVFGIALSVSYLSYALIEYHLDVFLLTDPVQPSRALSIAALVFEGGIWVFSVPWADPSNMGGRTGVDPASLANLSWCAAGLFRLTANITCYSATQLTTRNATSYGAAADFGVNVASPVFAVAATAIQREVTWTFGYTTLHRTLSTLRVIRIPAFSTLICKWIDPSNQLCPKALAKAAAWIELLGSGFAGLAALSITISTWDADAAPASRANAAPPLPALADAPTPTE